jgi:phosphate transport system substrate-binding protein
MIRFSALLAATACLALSACDSTGGSGGGGTAVRDQIRAVGSSTVYPFATAVAEQFVNKNTGMKSPIIESTGTGAGFKLFCGGIGTGFPDIANASRAIKKSEYEDCAKNKVTDVVEIQIGLDGIAFAEGKSGPKLELSPRDVYAALAANPFGKPQTAKTWKDVNPSLPAIPIKVYGPPSTSGTRDALAELILTKGCDTDAAMKALKDKDKDAHKKTCTGVREDGAFVDAGENDNLIVQKLLADPQAIGVFGYSFLEENAETLVGNPINGIMPTYATISDFSYPGARPLYIYVKSAHLKAIKGLQGYVEEFSSAWGPDGYLKKRGMVIAPDAVRAAAAQQVKDMKPLDPTTLK